MKARLSFRTAEAKVEVNTYYIHVYDTCKCTVHIQNLQVNAHCNYIYSLHVQYTCTFLYVCSFIGSEEGIFWEPISNLECWKEDYQLYGIIIIHCRLYHEHVL